MDSVSWTREPQEPIDIGYEPDEVVSIFNEDKQYFIYQKQGKG